MTYSCNLCTHSSNNTLLFNPSLKSVLILPPLRFSYKNRISTNVVLSISTNKAASTQQEYDENDKEAWIKKYGPQRLSPVEKLYRRGEYEGTTAFAAHVCGLETKFKLAIENEMLVDTIGIDLVAKSVNDVVANGVKPTMFSDYLSTSALSVDHAKQIQRGMVIACKQSDCFYVKEPIKKSRFYGEGEFCIAGVGSGAVKTDSIIDGKSIKLRDELIGLPSSGLHSNGFSLVRSVLEQSGSSLTDNLAGTNFTLGESLMAPTAIYVKQVLDIINIGGVKGIAHIKNGGLAENISRMLPRGIGATLYEDSWFVPPIFKWIQEAGNIEEVEMRRSFNMGIGIVLVCDTTCILRILGKAYGKNAAFCIGNTVSGDGVTYQ